MATGLSIYKTKKLPPFRLIVAPICQTLRAPLIL